MEFFSGIRLSMCNWNGDKEFYSLFCVTLVKRANSKKCGHDFEMSSLAENHMLTELDEYECALFYHLSKLWSDNLWP